MRPVMFGSMPTPLMFFPHSIDDQDIDRVHRQTRHVASCADSEGAGSSAAISSAFSTRTCQRLVARVFDEADAREDFAGSQHPTGAGCDQLT